MNKRAIFILMICAALSFTIITPVSAQKTVMLDNPNVKMETPTTTMPTTIKPKKHIKLKSKTIKSKHEHKKMKKAHKANKMKAKVVTHGVKRAE